MKLFTWFDFANPFTRRAQDSRFLILASRGDRDDVPRVWAFRQLAGRLFWGCLGGSLDNCSGGVRGGRRTFVRELLALVRELLALVRELLALVRKLLALVRELLALVREMLALVRNVSACPRIVGACPRNVGGKPRIH